MGTLSRRSCEFTHKSQNRNEASSSLPPPARKTRNHVCHGESLQRTHCRSALGNPGVAGVGWGAVRWGGVGWGVPNKSKEQSGTDWAWVLRSEEDALCRDFPGGVPSGRQKPAPGSTTGDTARMRPLLA